MKEIKLKVPEGLKYLSEWKDFDDLLPKRKHFILNKRLTGCGATEKFLSDDKPVIIAMPRKHLLYNKLSQHLNDNVFLYRFIDKKQFFSDKTPSKKQLEEFDTLLVDYLSSGGKKILATYDSLPKIISIMKSLGINPNEFKVVVDEMQQILGDAPFKANIEHQFYLALKQFDTVIYLSATPFLDEYLEMSEQFRDLPVVKLEWASDAVKKSQINVKKLTKSISNTCCDIIAKYKSGEGPTIKVEDETVRSKEAIFYLNDVSAIIDIIKKSGITPAETNILCAPRSENIKKISNLEAGEGEKFEIGTIPGKGESSKMFTFCTSTVYIGADFYSDNAYTYIFANPNVQSLCLDVATDLQQILGRLRQETNPYRNMADLYYHLNKPISTEDENKKMIDEKREETKRHIENFQTAKHPDSLIRAMEEAISKSSHKEHYCCISEDAHGKKAIVENSLIWIAERRAWDIANKVYSGDFSLFEALSLNADVRQDIDTDDKHVRKVFELWNEDGHFKRKAMLYCDLMENAPELLEKCAFIPHYFHEYYEALGRQGMEQLHWRADYIREAIAPTPPDHMPHEEIYKMLIHRLEVGKEYTRNEVKNVMKEIYTALSIKGKPSAIDCSRYITIEEFLKRVNKKNVGMIRIVSHYRRFVTYFPRITNVKRPTVYDIDQILEIIKTGNRFDIMPKVDAVRNSGTKDELDENKSKLPAIAWNGKFTYRDRNGCELYSSFTALDFDHIQGEEIAEFKEWIESFPCAYAYFLSPSGHGLKVIVLHDSLRQENHGDLYAQLLRLFKCNTTDSSTSDLGRGNYLSYDPGVWVNPKPVPFHYEPSKEPILEEIKTQTVVKGDNGNEALIEDDDQTARFLRYLDQHVITDQSIMNMLRKAWNQRTIDRGRNNTVLSYAGVLCKAGVDKDKAQQFVATLIPDLPGEELSRAVNYAYEHNIFGCNRREYFRRRNN